MQDGVGSSGRQKNGWGCAPPIAQAGCVGPDSRICVRRQHLLAGHHVKVPGRCLCNFCRYVCSTAAKCRPLKTKQAPCGALSTMKGIPKLVFIHCIRLLIQYADQHPMNVPKIYKADQ